MIERLQSQPPRVPSSSETRFRLLLAAASMMRWPTCTRINHHVQYTPTRASRATQARAHLSGAREGHFVHVGVRRERRAGRRSVAGHHVEHSRRQTGLLPERRQVQRCVRVRSNRMQQFQHYCTRKERVSSATPMALIKVISNLARVESINRQTCTNNTYSILLLHIRTEGRC